MILLFRRVALSMRAWNSSTVAMLETHLCCSHLCVLLVLAVVSDSPVVFQLQLAMWGDDGLDDDLKLRHPNAPDPKRRVTPTSKPDDRRFARKEV